MRSPTYIVRSYLCEILIGLSNKVAPKGYVSSTVQASSQLVLAERKYWTGLMHQLACAGNPGSGVDFKDVALSATSNFPSQEACEKEAARLIRSGDVVVWGGAELRCVGPIGALSRSQRY